MAASAAAQAAEVRSITEVPSGLASLSASAADLTTALPAALGLDAETTFSLKASNTLPNGAGLTLRLDQVYLGIPVWGQQVVVQVSPDNRVAYISGNAMFNVKGAAASPRPTLNAADALQRAKAASVAAVGAPVSIDYSNVETGLVYLLPPAKDKEAPAKRLSLAYRVSFYTDVPEKSGGIRPTRPVYFIDADSGAVLYSYENIQFDGPKNVTNGALGTGPGGNTNAGWTYGTSPASKFWVADDGANGCTMDDGAHVFTEDLHTGTTGSMTPFAFTCYSHTGSDSINGGNSPLNDAQDFGRALYDMYVNWYGVAPLNIKLWMRVHYSANYENAFWNGSSMAFGDGATTFYPLTGLDVTGHEVSHGFTEQHSNLFYDHQSGGMNEAYSDMAGMALEYYYLSTFGQLLPHAMPDFKVGEDIYKASGQALRYMCDPTQDGVSIDDARDYYNGLDVHYSSGVYNKAFCLLSKTAGWDARKALAVFLLANQSYWTANETFRTGVDDVVQAATTLGYSTADVRAAFAQVALQLPFTAANDNFVDAAPVPFSLAQSAGSFAAGWVSGAGNNTAATKESGEPDLSFNSGGKSVWLSCEANVSGPVTINTKGSNFNTILGVFTGSSVSSLTKIAEDDDSGGHYFSQITFNTVAGTTYYIMVDGYSGASGDIILNASADNCASTTPPPPPPTPGPPPPPTPGPTPPPLAPPPAPVATAATNVVSLGFDANWESSAGATGYVLDVSSAGDGTVSQDVGNVTSFADSNLSARTDYTYAVRAYNASGESAESNTVAVTTTALDPGTLLGMVVLAIAGLGSGRMRRNRKEDRALDRLAA